MPSTHLSLHYHIVFSTKERRELIRDEWRGRLHEYMGGCLKTLDAIPEAIGGTRDHVHILAGLRATHCLADVVKDFKTSSSRWVHTEIGDKLFAWQLGYAAFTVSVSQIDKVKNYILHQEEHHRAKGFQDEYIELLKLAQVDYDEQFLW